MNHVKIESEGVTVSFEKEEVREDYISFRVTDTHTQETLPYFFSARKKGRREIFIYAEGKSEELSQILYVKKVTSMVEALPEIITEALDLIEKEK
jgi:hypothetical protein